MKYIYIYRLHEKYMCMYTHTHIKDVPLGNSPLDSVGFRKNTGENKTKSMFNKWGNHSKYWKCFFWASKHKWNIYIFFKNQHFLGSYFNEIPYILKLNDLPYKPQ